MSEHNGLDAWIEWKEICAIEKCTKESKNFLNNRADTVLRYNIKRFSYSSLSFKDFMKNSAFAYFEMYALTTIYTEKKPELQGKSYKEGLFYKLANSFDNPMKVINGQLKFCLQGAIREFYKDDITSKQALRGSSKNPNSLNVCVGDDGEGVELQDLLPVNVISIEQKSEIEKLQTIAIALFDKIFAEMPFNHRVIVFAETHNIAKNNQVLLDVTKMKKSTLADHFKRIYKEFKYISIVKEAFPQEAARWEQLYKYALMVADQKIVLWAKSEKECQPLLTIVPDDLKHLINGEKNV